MKAQFLKPKQVLFVITCFFLQLGFAQVNVDEAYRHDYFQEIGSSNQLLYTYNGIRKEYSKFELNLYSPVAKKLSTTILEYKKGITFTDCISVGNNTVFYYQMRGLSTVLLLVFDANGKELTRKLVEYPKILKPKIEAISNDKFCLISGIKLKKPGILVECFDMNLTSQWKYENASEDTKLYLEHYAVSPDGKIAMYCTEKKKKDQIIIVDPTGAEKSRKEINTDEKVFKPYLFSFFKNQLVLVSEFGTADPSDLHTAMALGFNVKQYNDSGEETSSKNLDFKSFYTTIANRKVDGNLQNPQTPGIRVVDIVETNGVGMFVCEVYRFSKRTETIPATQTTSASKYGVHTMSLEDILMLDFDELTVKQKVWKPSRTISISGASSFASINSFCESLVQNNMFSYQFIEDGSIFFRGFSQNFEYFNKVAIGDSYENVVERTFWGEPIQRQNSGGKSVQVFVQGPAYQKLAANENGFLKTKETTVLYHLHSATGKLEFTVLKQ